MLALFRKGELFADFEMSPEFAPDRPKITLIGWMPNASRATTLSFGSNVTLNIAELLELPRHQGRLQLRRCILAHG